MAKPLGADTGVALPSIGMDAAAGLDDVDDEALQARGVDVGDMPQADAAADTCRRHMGHTLRPRPERQAAGAPWPFGQTKPSGQRRRSRYATHAFSSGKNSPNSMRVRG